MCKDQYAQPAQLPKKALPAGPLLGASPSSPWICAHWNLPCGSRAQESIALTCRATHTELLQ